MRFKRIFLIILDSLGVGEAIDAGDYNDNGCNTLKHIKENYNLFIPNLEKLGIYNTIDMADNKDVEAYYTIARPKNSGKDSVIGHYELMGIENHTPFQTFYDRGFPRELLDKIELLTRKRIIGNKVSNNNGLDIINELGKRHIEFPDSLILYTTYDSTLQIAAHEDVIPIPTLYDYAELIRKLTIKDNWRIARIVAKPFTGKEKFKFINDKCVLTLNPPSRSVLNQLKDKGFDVISVGKVNDIFNNEGITKIVKANNNNQETINKITDIMDKNFKGLCIANLSDFDQLYGHNKDVEGYGKCIEDLDVEIPMILNKLNDDDLLIFTADHGNDPTFKNNSHTRENVPVIVYNRCFLEPSKLDILNTFADIGATIAENFNVINTGIGTSFLNKLK